LKQAAAYNKRLVDVLGGRMAYHERCEAHVLLFLARHPTSAYLVARRFIPNLRGAGPADRAGIDRQLAGFRRQQCRSLVRKKTPSRFHDPTVAIP